MVRQVRTPSEGDENTLSTLGRKILRKNTWPSTGKMVHGGPTPIKSLWNCIQSQILSQKLDKGRLQWLGNVERMSEERTVKKVGRNIPEGRSVGKSRNRWLDDAENNLKNMGVRAWRVKQLGIRQQETDRERGHGLARSVQPRDRNGFVARLLDSRYDERTGNLIFRSLSIV